MNRYQFLSCFHNTHTSDTIDLGEACWWTVHPASKQRSEGEKVRVGDDLILVSVATERYLVFQPKICTKFQNISFWILRNNIHSHLFFFPSSIPPKRTIYRWWTPRSTWPTGPCNRTEQESAGWNTSVTYLAVTFFDSSTVATNVSPYHQHGAQRQVKSKYLKQRIRSLRFKVGRKF